MSEFPGLLNYWLVIVMMMTGFYAMISRNNLIKKVIGLSIFQGAVYLFYITAGKVFAGTAPILEEGFSNYSNPLPHVLILTAIVVGIATVAVALALIMRIKDAYGTVEEDEIQHQDKIR